MKNIRLTRRQSAVAAVAAGSLLLAGCGGSPTAGDAEESAAGSDSSDGDSEGSDDSEGSEGQAAGGCAGEEGTTARIAEINSELEGLGSDERQAALIEFAEEEGGEVSFYGSTNPDDINPVIDGFEDATGITVNHYRANSEGVRQRILEESSAGYRGADVANVGAVELMILEDEGILAEFETPVAEDIYEGGVHDTSVDLYRVMRVPLWNTNLVSEDEAPESWEDVLTNFKGGLIFDPTDWDWFGSMTKDYFIGELGMTEEEAIEMWKEAASGASSVKGHTLGTELVTSGEVEIAAVTYQHGHPPEDAPVEWEPAFPPIIYSAVGVALVECAQAPAAGLLLAEYMVGTEGQTILYEGGRTTANTTVDDAWPEEYDSIAKPQSQVVVTEERQKWEDLWEEVLRESGTL